MSAAELHERITRSLVDEIKQLHYPSVTMLNRVEETLYSRHALADYTESLIEKVETTRFPSIALLNRIDGLLDRLEQVERDEQSRAA
jgi:hypothetical protein